MFKLRLMALLLLLASISSCKMDFFSKQKTEEDVFHDALEHFPKGLDTERSILSKKIL